MTLKALLTEDLFCTAMAAKVLRTRWSAPVATLPKTVKPPLLLAPSVVLLSARLKKNWLVALLGSPESLAMAMVPGTLGLLVENSLGMAGLVAIELMAWVLGSKMKPPPCNTGGLVSRRWKKSLA